MKNLTVFCQNIQGLSINEQNTKKSELKLSLLLANKKRDIIVITETKVTEKSWIQGTSRGSKYYCQGYNAFVQENGARGLIVLVRKVSGILVKNIKKVNLDIIRLDIEIGPNKLTIFAVYGTSSCDDPQFFINLRTEIVECENEEIILLGDFNISLNKKMDLDGYTTDPHWRSRAVVNEWIESGDFTDAFRSLNPDAHLNTWQSPQGTKRARLDYILISSNLASKLQYCKITPCDASISDHQGVEACITLDKTPPGPGLFRANPKIEKDESYQNSVRYLINEELINLCNINDKSKEEEHKKNNELFKIRQDTSIAKPPKKIEIYVS